MSPNILKNNDNCNVIVYTGKYIQEITNQLKLINDTTNIISI